jgi:DNA polymerase (family 10)
MTNNEVAKLLRNIAAAYEIKGENIFRINAYRNAAEAVSHSTVEIRDLWKQNKLSTVSGVGPAIASHLDELFKTGKVKHFADVCKNMPQAMFTLMDIPGFGPKKAYRLANEFKLSARKAIDELYKAARSGKIAILEGFGDKSQEDIIEAIERFKKGHVRESRMPLPYAYVLAEDVINYLKENKKVLEAVPLGSLRRMVSTIGDIDIAISTNDPDAVVNWFVDYPKKEEIIEKGSSGATISVQGGKNIDLRVQSPGKFGAMLQYFTGSKSHNIKLREYALKQGLSLSEYGIKPLNKTKNLKLRTNLPVGKAGNYNGKSRIYGYATEEEFYDAIGLPWIPPEIREDSGEIEASLREIQGKPDGLPHLVDYNDIKGEFHIHSNYDLEPSHDLGTSELETILENARNLGYEYVGISDHNPSISNHTEEQIITIMKRRKEYFEQIMLKTKYVRVKLFTMMEIDILPEGKLAIPEAAFNFLDAAIVSVHSVFNLNKGKMTERVIKGLRHPKVKIIGHPTGRLLGKREGYEIDWSRLFKFCHAYDKAIEINSCPDRLDLPDVLVREAIREKVKLVVNTDSHNAAQMEMIRYGVSVARRGWAQKSDIINTLPYEKVKEWLLKKECVSA